MYSFEVFIWSVYSHVRVRVKGLEMLVFRKILRMHLMDLPKEHFSGQNDTKHDENILLTATKIPLILK